jgi:arsenite methyltransferase
MNDRTDVDVSAAVREKYGAIAKSIGSEQALRQGIGSSGQALRPGIGSSGQAGCGCGPLRQATNGSSGQALRQATNGSSGQALRQATNESSGQALRQATNESSGQACCGGAGDPITSNLYPEAETRDLPAEAVSVSLGCGNPTALLTLEPGQTVLDLGSGGGIDVLLSAKRVGPTGKVYGLDMTDEMLDLARENQRKAGATNVEFLKGTIEAIPLPDNSVDAIISNCVINLSTDKEAVLREAFRVLKPGGRFAVSDIVARGTVPPDVRRSAELWIGCLAGSLEESEYRSGLAAAGFADIEIDIWRVYDADIAGIDAIGDTDSARFASASIRALKPGRACCDPGCCG